MRSFKIGVVVCDRFLGCWESDRLKLGLCAIAVWGCCESDYDFLSESG
ncbi:MAG: hypothetical protein LW814_18155 [Anabaena sp. CoA2_C59]|nr:hypothetical protein [Anabaena sp. CoA2_C59]MDJ0507288.1 hypothetical protein [Nostocales cyanobacterium LE14-WE12]